VTHFPCGYKARDSTAFHDDVIIFMNTAAGCSVARSAASRWTKVVIQTPSPRKMIGPLERRRPFVGAAAPQCPPPAVQVPPTPSWSVRDLRLTPIDDDDGDDDCKISEEELATLARRCLIDVRRLSPERRDELRAHVAGIMRCASVLLKSKTLRVVDEEGDSGLEGPGDLTDEEVYDAPRGLTKMPIRIERDGEVGDWALNDSGESKAILRGDSVRSKMVKSDDDEMFFSVVTKRS
jgi:hypothetical protein